ncbi:hypothetical protein ACWOFR_02095 [Carnobacterium gallinarum]|uniref:hypothetical protein n=1 Tax=Carnobacterium gallinarum TaxID=2749 RepID=UPI000552F891|nr:hypothetical protein [Carnobacterium gallinarum]
MANKYITIDYKEFDELKNRVKTLEYYWMRYKSQNGDSVDLEFNKNQDSIEKFIKLHRYEELKMVRFNFRGTKVKMEEENYYELVHFADLAFDIQNKVN